MLSIDYELRLLESRQALRRPEKRCAKVRGAGCKLVNAEGEYFAPRYDERGELAPRDIVPLALSSSGRLFFSACSQDIPR